MTDDCPHCLAIRAVIEAKNVELGRPLDSFDHDIHAVPRTSIPSKADVAGCDCRCHSHLRIGGARP